MDDELPFKRDEMLDKPGIVGARWWHEGLRHADPVGRRTALKAVLVAGGLLGLGVLVSKGCSGSDGTSTANRNALEMQKQYGWSFGAATETVTFDGSTIQPWMPELVPQLASDLTPARKDLRPYYVPTLFQSLVATPLATLTGDPAVVVPLRTVIRPIRTAAMDLAYLRGAALASLFDATVSGVAVVVDLPGPEAVAFAAGAASVFDPVFLIDNWPHPRGVVHAHQTLAAALYYQPRFSLIATSRHDATIPSPPPMFVLDRDRLAPYADASTQFDNRHVARLPPVERLTELGIRRVLYVAPTDASVPELDDLNATFVGDSRHGIVVRMVGANAFGPDDGDGTGQGATSTYYYGHRQATHASFWVDYPWVTPARTGAHPASVSTLGKDYTPVLRSTSFGATGSSSPTFGTVPVILAATTGAVLGAAMSRSGSWNRSSGGWGG